MYKKIIISLLLIISIFQTQSYWNISELNNNDISIKVEWVFSQLTKNLEKKYSKSISVSKIEILLDQLYDIKEKQRLTGDKKIIIDSLSKLSHQYIWEYSYNQNKIKDDLKINNFPISNYFKNKTANSDSIFKENWVWYTYVFEKHLSFKQDYNPTLKDLEFNKIDTKNDLFFITKDNKAGFVVNYQKVRLIWDNLIYWIPNKWEFLKELRDDKFYLHDKNTDLSILKMKKLSQELTKNAQNTQEKIKILYDYVLKNTQYTQNIDLNDKKIFSAIETFENNSWVCEWYAKLFQYLLYFSDVRDVKTIRWYVVDATDYPTIWHAWVQIWDLYYDPTFDDPLWASKDKQYDEYLYYWLPKDLFYTNRYDYGESNEVLEKAPLKYREQYVKKQLIWVFQKYRNSNYNILKELQFREKYSLDFLKQLTLNDIYNSIDFIEVKNFTIQSTQERITNLQFYNITDKNINNILKQIDYDFDTYTLIKWQENNWEIIYRIWFNIKK